MSKYYEFELLNCPFCNSADIGINYTNRNFNVVFRYVVCNFCGASTRRFAIDYANPIEAEQKAVEAWNRRAKNG